MFFWAFACPITKCGRGAGKPVKTGPKVPTPTAVTAPNPAFAA